MKWKALFGYMGLSAVRQPNGKSGLRKMDISTAFFLLSLATIPVSHARDKNPPEVEALIGMRIPAKERGLYGDVQGWEEGTRGAFQDKSGAVLPIWFEELTKDNLAVFVIGRNNESDWSRVILDAQALPLNLLSYRLVQGKATPRGNAQQYYSLYGWCKHALDDSPIVALARPDPGKEQCEHDTHRIKLAWRIDLQTGKINEISPVGVSCIHIAGDECAPF